MMCSNLVHSSAVKDASPFKTMEGNNSEFKGVVKDTSPSETMEGDDNVQNSFVHTRVLFLLFQRQLRLVIHVHMTILILSK